MHGIIALFDTPMILFQPVIEIFIFPMEHLTAHYFIYCSRIGHMPVRRDTLRRVTHNCESLPEELFCCVHVAFFTETRINQVAIVINGSIQVAPFSMNFDRLCCKKSERSSMGNEASHALASRLRLQRVQQ